MDEKLLSGVVAEAKPDPAKQPSRGRRVRAASEAAYVASGQVVIAVGSLLALWAVTSSIEPEAYGELALAMTGVSLLQQVVYAPISQTLLRYSATADAESRFGLLARVASTRTALPSLSALAVGSVGAGALLIAGRTHLALLVSAALAYALTSGVEAMCEAVRTSFRQRPVVFCYQLVGVSIRTGMAALLVTVHPSSTSALSGFAIGSSVVVLLQAPAIRRWASRPAGDYGDQLQRWKTAITAYTSPVVIWAGISWMQVASDRWSLEAFTSREDVGRYAVLYQLGYYPILMLSSIITSFGSPIVFRRAGDGTRSAALAESRHLNRQLCLLTVGVSLVFTLLASAWHGVAFELVGDAAYRNVSPLLPWVVLAGGLFAAGQVATLAPMANADTASLLVPKVVTSLVGVAMTAAGAALFGIEGVIGSNIAFGFLYAVWISWFIHGSLGRRIEIPQTEGH